MSKHIIMTGATGLIGTRIYHALRKRGDRVTVLTRNPDKTKKTFSDAERVLLWAPGVKGEWSSAMEGADAVIHLAGEPIAGGRWTDEYKKRIYDSRVQGTGEIVEAIGAASEKPALLISASGVGYYGDTGDTEVDEDSPPGDDFLAQTCVDWENEAHRATEHGVRVMISRQGIVLAEEGGALEKLVTPFKMFAGGPVGNGEQWFPWVHIDDVVGIYLHALDNSDVSGILNAVSPDLLRNRDFAIALGETLQRPARFSVPGFVIKLALGEFGETLLGGQRAHPVRTLESGYAFKYPALTKALADLLQ
ncbi:MAG: TIGR01777 family oxidoreductase [Bacteroidetes bacterium]|nr:TIGR01777 family oxidoreductase [Bacteroidota bacterium]